MYFIFVHIILIKLNNCVDTDDLCSSSIEETDLSINFALQDWFKNSWDFPEVNSNSSS